MNISNEVMNILISLSGSNTIKSEHALQNDLGLDSLSMVTLLMELEDHFNFELKESDMNPLELKQVSDVVRLVERYCGGFHESGS